MRYPIAIEIGNETTAYGVVVPDLPGCFSAGDTLDEAITATEEAAVAWIEATLDAGGVIPPPSSLEAIRAMPEYDGWAYGLVNVDPTALDTRSERVNIILPRRVLLRLDTLAKENGMSRSGFVAHLAMVGRVEG
jgi:predicted RNase H-like HicB family nuclease